MQTVITPTFNDNKSVYILIQPGIVKQGVTLAQPVKASVGQADVQRFEPHLGITG